jgi:hypothetical protein
MVWASAPYFKTLLRGARRKATVKNRKTASLRSFYLLLYSIS